MKTILTLKHIKKSSKIWLKRQHKDLFVKKSKQEGYRSRAAYKLLELQQKYSILSPGMKVIDLGAAPGSWSQVAANILALDDTIKSYNKLSKLIAVDLLPIETIKNVDIILGDINSQAILEKIYNVIIGVDLNINNGHNNDKAKNAKVDVILSDMAPNLSGIWTVDIPKSMELAAVAMNLVIKLLKEGGSFLIKIFQGEGFEKYLLNLRKYFNKVIICKPKSSRVASREVYVLARGYNNKLL